MNRRAALLGLSAVAGAASPSASAGWLGDFVDGYGVTRRFLSGRIPIHSYRLESASMLPTLALGDVLLGDLRAAGAPPMRGEMIVFCHSDGRDWMKRVVGLPGERIAFKNWRMILNGAEVQTSDAGEDEFTTGEGRQTLSLLREAPPDSLAYLTVNAGRDEARLAMFADAPEVVVAPGRVYVLGDNRGQSIDSRAPTMGTIAIDNILGRIVYRLRPNPAWLAPEESIPGLPAE